VIEISRQQLVVYAAAALAVALIGARYLKQERDPPPRPSAAAAVKLRRSGSAGAAYVHVTGAVRRPGVYRLPPWARLDLAIRRAGGATARADTQGVNLAAKVSDGQQVIVPMRAAQAGGLGAAAAPAGAATDGGAASGPISLNTATLEQLDQLDGIGPTTAQKILDWRTEHGGFASVDDLRQISGIGPKRFESLREKVRM
jgi:competence protein ComEA